MNPKSLVCDVNNFFDFKNILEKIRPEIIINSIGILPRDPKFNKINSISINSLFPQKLREISNEFNSKIIQISTDCVFDGKRGKYSENDIPNESKVYGITKFLGEIKNSWAKNSYVTSFKLETDIRILTKKAHGAIDKYNVDLVIANELHTRYDKVILHDSKKKEIVVLKENHYEYIFFTF